MPDCLQVAIDVFGHGRVKRHLPDLVALPMDTQARVTMTLLDRRTEQHDVS